MQNIYKPNPNYPEWVRNLDAMTKGVLSEFHLTPMALKGNSYEPKKVDILEKHLSPLHLGEQSFIQEIKNI